MIFPTLPLSHDDRLLVSVNDKDAAVLLAIILPASDRFSYCDTPQST